MKKLLFTLGLLLCFFYSASVFADCRGCCSRHGGVVCRNGVTMCGDGTPLSAKCSAKGCSKCYSSSSSKAQKIKSQPSAPAPYYYSNQSANEKKWYGRVLAVVDGDTINAMHDGKPEKIRLYGIDTPEKNQNYGSEATIATFKMVNDIIVEVQPTTKDKYGRTIAWVYVGSKCVNEELIKEGFAWHYKQYSSDKELSDLEESARKNKVGLWADTNPIAPWDFRHGKTASKNINSPSLIADGKVSYRGNIQSQIFHHPSCKYYNCKNCISIFSDREQAISSGYRPCKICNP